MDAFFAHKFQYLLVQLCEMSWHTGALKTCTRKSIATLRKIRCLYFVLLFVSEVAKLNVKNEYLLFRFQITFAELQWRRKMKQMRDNEYQVDYDGEDNNNDGEHNNNDDVNGNEKDDLINRVLLKIKTFTDQSHWNLKLVLKTRCISNFNCSCLFSSVWVCAFFPHIL